MDDRGHGGVRGVMLMAKCIVFGFWWQNTLFLAFFVFCFPLNFSLQFTIFIEFLKNLLLSKNYINLQKTYNIFPLSASARLPCIPWPKQKLPVGAWAHVQPLLFVKHLPTKSYSVNISSFLGFFPSPLLHSLTWLALPLPFLRRQVSKCYTTWS